MSRHYFYSFFSLIIKIIFKNYFWVLFFFFSNFWFLFFYSQWLCLIKFITKKKIRFKKNRIFVKNWFFWKNLDFFFVKSEIFCNNLNFFKYSYFLWLLLSSVYLDIFKIPTLPTYFVVNSEFTGLNPYSGRHLYGDQVK